MTMKVGIIGAGGIALLSHLPSIAKVDGLEVKTVHSRKAHRVKVAREKFGVPESTDDPETILADDEIEAVVVSTPHAHHVEWGVKALEAGKHLLVQKPLCADMDEANAFVEAAEKSDKTCFVLPHFSAAIYKCREMVDAGALGKPSGALARQSHGGPEVYYAEVADGFGEERATDLWFFDSKRASVGALFDMGVYAVANLVAVLGKALSVMGRLSTVDKPTDLEDTATLIIEFANGALATAETGWCDPARTGLFRVHGSEGKLMNPGPKTGGFEHWTPTSSDRENAPPKIEPVDASGAGRGEIHRFWLKCIQEGRQPDLSTARCARHVTEILLAGLESNRTGQRVELSTAP